MQTDETMRKRFIGSMIGLAVGDAVGAPVEFMQRDSYKEVTGFRSGGKFGLRAGEWTDDTAMALCLAQSLLDNGFDQRDQLAKYLKWFKDGYMSATGRSVGCGKTVMSALLRYEYSGCCECGNSRLKKGAGNGSLMRVAPVALYYSNNLKLAMQMAYKSSFTTHGLKICADSCSYMSALIVGALNCHDKEKLLSSHYIKSAFSLANITISPELLDVANGSFKNKDRSQICSSGYVIDTIESALWAFYNTDNFTDGLFLAVNLGLDSDTVGAVYGQLAGAFYGVDGIREDLRNRVLRGDFIEKTAIRLFDSFSDH